MGLGGVSWEFRWPVRGLVCWGRGRSSIRFYMVNVDGTGAVGEGVCNLELVGYLGNFIRARPFRLEFIEICVWCGCNEDEVSYRKRIFIWWCGFVCVRCDDSVASLECGLELRDIVREVGVIENWYTGCHVDLNGECCGVSEKDLKGGKMVDVVGCSVHGKLY